MQNNNIKSVKVLDCTLRDGGYYNNWCFEDSLVKNYIQSIKKSKIDFMEIGFRNLKEKSFLGPYAYSKEDILVKFFNKRTKNIAVMIDAKDFIGNNSDIKKKINSLFLAKKNSLVSIVRIATQLSEIKNCRFLSNFLKELGYFVVLNLMQIGNKSNKEIEDAGKIINSWNSVEVLYFADSIGCMNPESVKKTIFLLKKNWKKEIGIHAHDNKGMALLNTLAALENGVTWLDSTIDGMGRGAGNTKTELLLLELNKKNKHKSYNTEEIFKLSANHFKKLKTRYLWGANIYYYLAAEYNIHPTYIQKMLTETKYSNTDILKAINHMKKISAASFDESFLTNFVSKKNINRSYWKPSGWCKGKNILLIGGGDSIKNFNNQIINFIKIKKPIVLSINIQKSINKNYINGYIASNSARILMDSAEYGKSYKYIYAPKDALINIANIKEKTKLNFRNYSIRIKKNEFRVKKNFCILPSNLGLAYAIALLTIGQANKIFMAGIDGYPDNELKNDEILSSISKYKNLKNHKELISITPTIFPLKRYDHEM
jgi:4-hydroxy 2-oxovalerate aldolase